MRPIAIVASSAWVSSVQLLKLFSRVRDSSSFRLSLYHVYAYYSYKFLYVESCSTFIYVNFRRSYYNNYSCYPLVLCKFKYVMYLVIMKLFHYRNQFSSLFIRFNYACVSFCHCLLCFDLFFFPFIINQHHQSNPQSIPNDSLRDRIPIDAPRLLQPMTTIAQPMDTTR